MLQQCAESIIALRRETGGKPCLCRFELAGCELFFAPSAARCFSLRGFADTEKSVVLLPCISANRNFCPVKTLLKRPSRLLAFSMKGSVTASGKQKNIIIIKLQASPVRLKASGRIRQYTALKKNTISFFIFYPFDFNRLVISGLYNRANDFVCVNENFD